MKKILKSVSICLIIAAILTGGAFAAAPVEPDHPQASEYISGTSTAAGALGNGKVRFTFSITATRPMKDVGATQVDVFEVGNDSNPVLSCHHTSSAYDYIMGHNTGKHVAGVTYYGQAGKQYYAKVRFFAGEYGVAGDVYTMGTAIVTAV